MRELSDGEYYILSLYLRDTGVTSWWCGGRSGWLEGTLRPVLSVVYTFEL